MKLKEIIQNAKSVVVFTGAGISVPSGIPDFRSANGLYSKKYGNLEPEKIISHSYFMENTKEFFKFYHEKMIFKDAKPNLAHFYFAQIGAIIVTQNIDNLHTLAGSKRVYELHGNVYRNYCMDCHKYYDLENIDLNGIPRCTCGGIIKPDVVLYEEPLDENIVAGAIKAIEKADVLIVVGTSLTVYPAAYYVSHFAGEHLIIINKQKTPYDNVAEMVFHEDIIKVINDIK